MSKILVFAEQRDGELKKVAFENLSLGKKELYQLVPALSPHCVGALICREDGYGRPYHALTAFRRKAESLGVTF